MNSCFRTLLALLVSTGCLAAGTSYDKSTSNALKTLRSGGALGREEQLACQEKHEEYYKSLFETDKSFISKRPASESTDFFINAMKMCIIYPSKHGGWPLRSTLPLVVSEELETRMEKDPDPMLRFCAIYAALREKQRKYAVYLYEELKKTDPFLAREILIFAIRTYDKTGDRNWIKSYYRSIGNEAKVAEVEKETIATAFPDGLEKVNLDDFDIEPDRGVIFVSGSKRMAEHGLKAGDIITAIDGYRCVDFLQYKVIRNQKTGDKTVVVWDGTKYREVKASLPKRLWGATMASHPVPYSGGRAK